MRMPETRQHWIAVLGQRDEPTDALEDYCLRLAAALDKKGCSLELVRVDWAGQGWRGALGDLAQAVARSKASWAVVQYTTLSWSRRGFPVGFLRLIRRLRRTGIKIAIVYHEPQTYGGHRMRDRVRRRIQLLTMVRSARLADRIVTTISPDGVGWMGETAIRSKVCLIPVGSNVSEPSLGAKVRNPGPPTIVVFGITGGQREEALLIARVVLRVVEAFGGARLIVLGRGATEAEPAMREVLDGSAARLEVFGLVSCERAAALLSGADVQLFVRSGLTSSRGSAIAGITCGLPVVGFSGEDTAFPITEAGVRLVAKGNVEAMVQELLAVLRDENLRQSLQAASCAAAQKYFSWSVIADQCLSFLNSGLRSD